MKAHRTRLADPTKILMRRELAAVLAALTRKAKRSPSTRLNLVIFRVATCCGLRASEIAKLQIMSDPEALFQIGTLLCDVGEFEQGLRYIRQSVAKGYFVAPTLERRTQFDAVRDQPHFQAMLATAQEGRTRSLAAFRDAGGERLLGRR